MKTFLVLNGKSVYIRNFEAMTDAVTYAQNYMGHSKEIIVREIDSILKQTNHESKENK